MRVVTADQVHGRLDYSDLADALAEMFAAGCETPLRHHHTVKVPEAPDATLLLMPAWQSGQSLGIKIVTVFPGNASRSLPAVMGQYLLLDATTGEPKALIDGTALTLRRTAAASALASTFLSREDSAHLLMVGTGSLAPHLIRAHGSVRRLKRISIWGRNPDHARATLATFDLTGIPVEMDVADDLEQAVRAADIISCATLATAPLIRGAWLRPGQHIDLVGGFTPAMREADDDAVRRAAVYIDTRGGAMKEAGDIVQPLANGALKAEAIKGDLFDLCGHKIPGRTDANAITLFKSVGTALEDLAAAQLLVRRMRLEQGPFDTPEMQERVRPWANNERFVAAAFAFHEGYGNMFDVWYRTFDAPPYMPDDIGATGAIDIVAAVCVMIARFELKDMGYRQKYPHFFQQPPERP